MAKFDSVLCHSHVHRVIHNLRHKQCVDRYGDSFTHSVHWHSVRAYCTGMASVFPFIWTYFCLGNVLRWDDGMLAHTAFRI